MNREKIEPFLPLSHGEEVFSLWNAVLGESYPLSERVFIQNTFGNFLYRPGDGFVAFNRQRITGFALVSFDERNTGSGKGRAALSAILVHPAFQRRRLGSALLDRVTTELKGRGATELGVGSAGGTSLFRFWAGVPADLPAAVSFFKAKGFDLRRGTYDLIRDVRGCAVDSKIRNTIHREEALISPLTKSEISQVLAFEQQKFPYWAGLYRLIVSWDDWPHILLVRKNGVIVGSCCTYGPESRYRSANLTWELLLGNSVGGLGAVGIAEQVRGRGLGLALCATAVEGLKREKVDKIVVDWTSLTDFYGKLGFTVWKEHWMGNRRL